MKEETFGNNEKYQGLSKNTPDNHPFNPANRTDTGANTNKKANLNNLFQNLSKPPQRDMSGKRVDVDDAGFGIEIW